MTESEPRRVAFKFTHTLASTVMIAVEPWAHEFALLAKSTFELITHDDGKNQSFDVDLTEGLVTIWVNSGVVLGVEIDGTDVWPHPREEPT